MQLWNYKNVLHTDQGLTLLATVAAAGISSRLVQIIDTKLSKRCAASSLESG